jgi:hypothetical protein
MEKYKVIGDFFKLSESKDYKANDIIELNDEDADSYLSHGYVEIIREVAEEELEPVVVEPVVVEPVVVEPVVLEAEAVVVEESVTEEVEPKVKKVKK